MPRKKNSIEKETPEKKTVKRFNKKTNNISDNLETTKDDKMEIEENPKDDKMEIEENPKDDKMEIEENPKDDKMEIEEITKDDKMEIEEITKDDKMEIEENPKNNNIQIEIENKIVNIYKSNEVSINESKDLSLNIDEKNTINVESDSVINNLQFCMPSLNENLDNSLKNLNIPYPKKNIEIIINELSKSTLEYTLNNNELNNILEPEEYISKNNDFKVIRLNYSLDNLKQLFYKFNESVILIEVINGKIKFIEKKGHETRNQSVIDLLIKANNYKKLPDVQFIIFTNDNINHKNLFNNSFLLTFCRNQNCNTNLFPNFNFNHWKEANIDFYENVYEKFLFNQISWEDKKENIFWSGKNTNIIRKKIFDESQKDPKYLIKLLTDKSDYYIPIDEVIKYKYLLNMNGYSYGGRLNYLFLSGSCVIILKNNNKNLCYDEFFYDNFIPNEDYIEINYDDNEVTSSIINKINNSIQNYNGSEIAQRCFKKAVKIFNMNNIYEYIHDVTTYLSKKNTLKSHLENTVLYTPSTEIFYKNRLVIVSNQINFNFQGKDFEININDIDKNVINIKIKDSNTKILYNNDVILEKYTPHILNENKNQFYQIIIHDNKLNLFIERTFNLVKTELPNANFKMQDVSIRTEFGGWWIL